MTARKTVSRRGAATSRRGKAGEVVLGAVLVCGGLPWLAWFLLDHLTRWPDSLCGGLAGALGGLLFFPVLRRIGRALSRRTGIQVKVRGS